MAKVEKNEGYDIYEHVHRFAAWAASRAAQRGLNGFTVEVGRKIIKNAEIHKVLRGGIHSLPDKKSVDIWHKKWCEKLIKKANEQGLTFSHGRAAKLMNVYLKTGFVTIANKHNKKVGALHPPIDRAVLEGLRAKNRDLPGNWTQLDPGEYQTVIDCVRDQLHKKKEERLWMIETLWDGNG